MNIQETLEISVRKENLSYQKLIIYDRTLIERLERIGYSVKNFVNSLHVQSEEGTFQLPKAHLGELTHTKISHSECLLDGINENIRSLRSDTSGIAISEISVPESLQIITNEYIDIILLMEREQGLKLIDRNIRNIVVKIA